MLLAYLKHDVQTILVCILWGGTRELFALDITHQVVIHWLDLNSHSK